MLPSDGARKKPELGTGKKNIERERGTQREREEEREEKSSKNKRRFNSSRKCFSWQITRDLTGLLWLRD